MAWRRKDSHKQSNGSSGQDRYIFEVLEPRVLLSADPLAGFSVDALEIQLASELEQLDAPDPFLEAPIHQSVGADTPRPSSSPGVPPPLDLAGLSQLLDTRSSSPGASSGIGSLLFWIKRSLEWCHSNPAIGLKERLLGRLA